MPILAIASLPDLHTHGLTTIIILIRIRGLAMDTIPAFTSVTPDSTDRGSMTASVRDSAARPERGALVRDARSEHHRNVNAIHVPTLVWQHT
jgi:hypothetical protein